MCWATSATMVVLSPSTSVSNSRAKLISGRASGGNSTSTTGPMMATMRPSLRAVFGASLTMLTGVPPLWWSYSGARRAGLGEALGAADDLGDLGGDRILAGPVGDPLEVLDQ